MSVSSLWNRYLGRRMTGRLRRKILPDLVWNQEVYGNLIRRYLKRDMAWLDAGCGWRMLGEDLEPLEDALLNTAGLVVGVDIERQSLSKHRNIFCRVCSALDALPFAERSFDLVTCNMVAEHLSNPHQAFAELRRVLKPNGVLVVHTPNTLNYLVKANQLFKKVVPHSLLVKIARLSDGREPSDFFPTFYRANSVRKLRQLFSDVGLDTEEVRVLTAPQPFFRFFAPLAFLELLLMRATMGRTFRGFGADILIAGRAIASNVREVSQRSDLAA